VVAGVPKPKQGRISTYLAKEESEDDTIMRIARHGDEGASHAVTYYAVVETSAQKLAWVSLKPVTGRTINCARIWRISITPSSAIPNISQGELGTAGRIAESPASVGAPDRDPASARRRDRRHRTLPRICCNPGICSRSRPTGSIDRERARGIVASLVPSMRRHQVSASAILIKSGVRWSAIARGPFVLARDRIMNFQRTSV